MDTVHETAALKPPRRSILRRSIDRLSRGWNAVKPGPQAWKSAAWGLFAGLVLIVLILSYFMLLPHGWPAFLAGVLGMLGAFSVLAALLLGLGKLLRRLPSFYGFALLALLFPVLLLGLLSSTAVGGAWFVLLGLPLVLSLLGAGAGVLRHTGWKALTGLQRLVLSAGLVSGVLAVVFGAVYLLDNGSPRAQIPDAAQAALEAGAQVTPIALPDPSQPGSYPVQTLFYGSGTDPHRPEFGSDVTLQTGPVDASRLVEGWSGLRKSYWGFGPEALPVNGRVWYPQGDGPFPLLLIVHGNHIMEESSDPGYAYLGELLASRGFIVASVDENFLNLSPAIDFIMLAGLEEENDARAYLLLEHLKSWEQWNAAPGNPLYGKVDLQRIALAGHSRGGEAVALAATFNRLGYYPDDASLKFDFGYNIRAVIAIAPVDGQYMPSDREAPLENINYLVLHGAQDMDVIMFDGSRAYNRLRFTDGEEHFKAAVYVYGANHGQFNQVWGNKDSIEPAMRFYNLEQLLRPEQQQQVARVYISAFLESTLHEQSGYQALFQDHRTGAAWLPQTVYVTQYQDSQTQIISDYEEDVDPGSTSLAGGAQHGQNLSVWREAPVRLKGGTSGNQAVYLGWSQAVPAEAGERLYAIQLPQNSPALTPERTIVFSLADAKEDPTPKPADGEDPNPDDWPVKGERPLIDLSVEVVDAGGQTARLALSSFSYLQPQIEGRLGKLGNGLLLPDSEAVFQTFQLPLAQFAAANPDLDITRLAEIRFVFDKTEAGVVVLDNLGIR